MEKTAPNNLEDALLLLEDAALIRERRKAEPIQDPDADTEEDVITAMYLQGIAPQEIIQKKNRYTRALRIILRLDIDPKR
ncbi:hypothetical protein KW801_03310 [Candidatus Saccharibacteria bacterium]|nr:hypothetical protein [Candidatus Saccharibacteria bacterium]